MQSARIVRRYGEIMALQQPSIMPGTWQMIALWLAAQRLLERDIDAGD